MNILFVCSRNKWRSRTAETIYKNNAYHNIKSAGTEKSARIIINQKMINWADLIFVMEKKHKIRIENKFDLANFKNEIEILEIPDEYKYMDSELVEVLKISVNPYIIEQ